MRQGGKKTKRKRKFIKCSLTKKKAVICVCLGGVKGKGLMGKKDEQPRYISFKNLSKVSSHIS